jgi:AraC-like DNA-binding protein
MKRIANIPIVTLLKEPEFDFTPQAPYRIWTSYPKEAVKVRLHYHSMVEVIACDGKVKGSLTLAGQKIDLSKHSVCAVSPLELHSLDLKPSQGRIIYLQISLPSLSHWLSNAEIEKLSISSISEKSEEIKREMEKLFETEPANELNCLGTLLNIIGMLKKSGTNENPVTSLPADIKRVVFWTQDNFRLDIDLDMAAGVAAYSRFHFCRRFKTYSGQGYHDFLNNVRLDYAKNLLLTGTNVTEACYESGFKNLSAFVQLFKRVNKISPKKFKMERDIQRQERESF